MGAREAVLGCHDLLVRVLSFAPTPSDLGRYAVVSKAFREASGPAGGLLARRTLPVAAVLHASGTLELNRGGLGLRIARAFANPPMHHPTPPLSDYVIMIQVRDEGKCGVVSFSSSGVLTDELCDGGQQFANAVEQSEDAESDSFWNDYCADRNVIEGSVAPAPYLVDEARLQLYIVLVRSSDGAVHQLVHGDCLALNITQDADEDDETRFATWWCDCSDEDDELIFFVSMEAK